VKLIFVLLVTLSTFACGGYGSNSGSGNMGGATPQISQLMPNTANAGDPAFTLTVNGSGFATSSVVYFNGVTKPTTYATGSQLTAAIAAADIANAGTIPVYVRTSGGQYGNGTNSNTMNFTVN
jgi:hypothetical protein